MWGESAFFFMLDEQAAVVVVLVVEGGGAKHVGEGEGGDETEMKKVHGQL